MAWMASTPGSGGRTASPTVFEQQREELVRDIAVVRFLCICEGFRSGLNTHTNANIYAKGMEQVLQNINRLNRNLESIIAVRAITFEEYISPILTSSAQVGNEFGSVEALWSQFENFMGPPEEESEEAAGRRKVSGEQEGRGESGAHEGEEQ